ncbi:MAG TPA: substrate-binding domain-containing protein [Planctomycetota bacterium]|jgi:DNA-binding LacI/PurR family transcriptional regulator/DNA-binding transcriptional regulator YhcF (GntR family)
MLAKPVESSPAEYRRVEQDLRARIRAGQWAPGALLPNRRQLAREYGVAVNTIQRAMAALLADKTIAAFGRRGTIVGRGEGRAPILVMLAATADSKDEPARQGSPAASNGFQADTQTATLAVISAVDRDIRTVPTESSTWVITVVRALERAFTDAGGRTRYFNVGFPCGESYPTAGEALRAAMRSGAGALAMINVDEHAGWLEDLNNVAGGHSAPVVYVSSKNSPTLATHVFYQQRHSGYHAAQHLLSSGYRQLIFITPYVADWVDERVDGARAAVQQAGLSVESLLTWPPRPEGDPLDFWRMSAQAKHALLCGCVLEALGRFEPANLESGLCAIIAPNDEAGCVIRQILLDAGHTPGRDIGLIGFDNDLRAGMLGLSSMAPPLDGLGQAAAELVLRGLKGEAVAQQVCLYAHLIQRASTNRLQRTAGFRGQGAGVRV